MLIYVKLGVVVGFGGSALNDHLGQGSQCQVWWDSEQVGEWKFSDVCHSAGLLVQVPMWKHNV